MNTKRNWTQVAVVVVLAVASLSSTTAVAAMSAPHRDRLSLLAADLCGVTNVSQFDQYMAAIEWAERGGQVPVALSVSCVENSPDLTASLADLGGDSGERWEQYMAAVEGRELALDSAPVHTVTGGPDAFEQYTAAIEWAERGGAVPEALSVSGGEGSLGIIASHADNGGDSGERWEQYMAAVEGRELALDAAPVHTVTGGPDAFEQYTAAIEWAERGGPVPEALTVSGGENSLDLTAPLADLGGDSGERWEQYMAAIEGRELALDAAPVRTVAGGGARSVQYQAPVDSTGKVRTFAPQAPTGEHDLQLFAQYLAAVANAGHGPTFASEADWGKPD